MSMVRLLEIAGVPAELHKEALSAINAAEYATKGLTWAKWKVRIFKAGKIAKMLDWEDERLCIKHPELADWDIAPMVNITAHGDNPPWEMTPEGGRPVPGRWLNKDPESAEYRQAVADNYWCKGTHPRSKKSRKAWYRRNAGEYRAWRMGRLVDPSLQVERWTGEDKKTQVQVVRCGDAWIINSSKKLVGRLYLKGRYGFEVDNIFTKADDTQAWYPIEGCELRAPATWSTVPKWAK